MKASILAASLGAFLGLAACAGTPSGPSPIHGTGGQDNPGANETPATGSSTGSGATVVPGSPTYYDRDAPRR